MQHAWLLNKKRLALSIYVRAVKKGIRIFQKKAINIKQHQTQQLARVEHLIGADINFVSAASLNMTWTLLHDACEHFDAKCILERCKTHCCESLEVDDHGSTPLHILAWGNPDPILMDSLVSCCPAALADKDTHGNTCLHIACSYPDTDPQILEMIIDACPTLPSVTNKEGLMPLHAACRFAPKNEHMIGYLVQVYPYALHSRIKMGDPAPCRKESLKARREGDHFVRRDRANFAEARFQSLSHQVRDGAYALHIAVGNGATRPVVELLIKAASDVLLLVNKYGETPLHVALATGAGDDVVEVLVEYGLSALSMKDKSHKNTPLHIAAMDGCSVAVAKTLLKKCMSAIHEKNFDGMTPLDLAIDAGKCSDEVIRLLEMSDG